MATRYYAFCDLGHLQNGCSLPLVKGDSVVSGSITLSASNQQTAAATKPYARVVTDTACFLAVGSSPDATTATARIYLPANAPEYVSVGVGNKIAAAT